MKFQKLKAFTLVEMLIVMAIIMLLVGLGFISVAGTRDVYLRQNFLTLMEDDIRYAQRSAMFLERGEYENWVYGVGIDFSALDSENSSTVGYTMIKWCSPDKNFDYTNKQHMGELPAFDSSQEFSLENGGQFPSSYQKVAPDEGCTGSIEKVIPMSRNLTSGITNKISPRVANFSFGSDVRYIIFESVTGRAFLYDQDGKLQNYITGGCLSGECSVNMVANITKFNLRMGPKSNTKRISVYPVSGRVEIL